MIPFNITHYTEVLVFLKSDFFFTNSIKHCQLKRSYYSMKLKKNVSIIKTEQDAYRKYGLVGFRVFNPLSLPLRIAFIPPRSLITMQHLKCCG